MRKLVVKLCRCFAIVAAFGANSASASEISATTRQATVTTLATALRDRYVFPDVGAKAAAEITANLQAGRYDGYLSWAEFAERLTGDLSNVTHDKHLRVIARERPEMGLRAPPHSEAGIVRADILVGGTGYIEVASFPPLSQFKPVADRAISALADSNALIIDVRRNTGGDPASVAYLVSFLLPSAQRIHINDVVSRVPGTADFTRQAFDSQATPISFAGRRIFVLTSKDTFSGGEEFAYDVANLKAAIVVGEVTRGGANPTGTVPIGEDVMALVPYGRAENPITRTNWDGSGVRPQIAVASSGALAVATKRLGRGAEPSVERASTRQVFAPRSTAIAGSKDALMALIAGTAAGEPPYASMAPHAVETTKRDLVGLQATLAQVGPIKGMTFREVDEFGGDLYDVAFQNGAMSAAVMIAADGRIEAWGLFRAPAENKPATMSPPTR